VVGVAVSFLMGLPGGIGEGKAGLMCYDAIDVALCVNSNYRACALVAHKMRRLLILSR
jgi:hypothetical protein